MEVVCYNCFLSLVVKGVMSLSKATVADKNLPQEYQLDDMILIITSKSRAIDFLTKKRISYKINKHLQLYRF